MLKRSIISFLAFICTLMVGCASKPPAYSGIIYPATNQADVTFQENGVPNQCRVISHLIVHTPSGASSARIGQKISDYAKSKGANLIFIGISRKISGKGPDDFQFFSFGPKQEYVFSKGWLGWKFGFEDWEKGGSIIGFGHNNWSDAAVNEYGMMLQTILLRCESERP